MIFHGRTLPFSLRVTMPHFQPQLLQSDAEPVWGGIRITDSQTTT